MNSQTGSLYFFQRESILAMLNWVTFSRCGAYLTCSIGAYIELNKALSGLCFTNSLVPDRKSVFIERPDPNAK